MTHSSQAGYEVLSEPAITYDELRDRSIRDAEGLVVTTRIKVDRALLDKALSPEMDRQVGQRDGAGGCGLCRKQRNKM